MLLIHKQPTNKKAALSGNLELVQLLADRDGSLVSAVDDRFATPLHYAAYGHRLAVAEVRTSDSLG
jgi:hypothetical protein